MAGIFINEQNSLQENAFLYEEKLKSPLTRFLNTTPVYVTYYHLNTENTLVDTGYADVFSLIGVKSSARYDKIENFPLYDFNPVQINLENQDQGIDGSYGDDAVILNNTIRPVPNSFFIVPNLPDNFLFRVTNIQYDTAVPDNFYKIEFVLDYIDKEKIEQLEKQVLNDYSCVIENFGTEQSVIVEKSLLGQLNTVKALYTDMADTFKNIFYNEKHNCFLGEVGPNQYLYDPLQTEFVNKHKLFNQKNNLQIIMLAEQFTDPKRPIKYEKSIYRFIERRNINLIQNFYFVRYPGVTQLESSFYRWADRNIFIAEAPINEHFIDKLPIFSNEFIEAVKEDGETFNVWQEVIKKYIRGDELSLNDFTSDLMDVLLKIENNIEIFFLTPIVLYIMKETMNKSLSK